jgi:cbb3-type cytochrome oxidase subunit 3
MKEVIAGIDVLFLVLIPGSAFAYWDRDRDYRDRKADISALLLNLV